MIFVDDKSIKVSGTVLPGLIKSIEIKDDVLIEEQDIEGSSAKAKQVIGYDDAKVTIELILEASDKVSIKNKLDKIQNLFRKANQTKPTVHQIVNDHTAARKVSKVVFKGLSSKEENTKERMVVTLEFWAYKAVKITAAKSATAATANTAPLDPAYQSYLDSNRGSAPKTNDTPAVDDDTPHSYGWRIANLPY